MHTHAQCTQIAILALLLATASPALPAEPDATVLPEARTIMLSMPRPQYPEEALRRHITGSGRCELIFNPNTGRVTRVTVIESSNSKLLDDAAAKTYFRWRAQPGKVSRMRVPFTFTFAR
jgi:TonB family protein